MNRNSIFMLLVCFVAGCSGGGADLCADLVCGDHGSCTVVDGAAGCYCEQDYIDEGDGCIHSKLADCLDVAPANASSTVEQVEITYTNSGGWSDPAECAWTCDDGLVEQDGACACPVDSIDEGAGCISSKLVDCVDAAPANASSTTAQVEITYTTAGGWSDPAECAWTCDDGLVEQDGACACPVDSIDEGAGCISSKLVDCVDAAPANASSTLGQVEITYTTSSGWTEPADCPWTCDLGHEEIDGACLCHLGSCVDGVCDLVAGACVPDETYPTGPYGTGVGDVLEDALLPEADGYDVAFSDAYTLYQAIGRPKVLILNFSEMSCSPSQGAASDYPQFLTDYAAGGGDPADIEHITILSTLDGVDYAPATVQQASSWKNTFGLTSPVVVDPDLTIYDRFAPTQTPTFWIIDPATMQVVEIVDGYAGWQDIESRIAPIIADN